MKNEVISKLRSQYLDYEAKASYGPRNMEQTTSRWSIYETKCGNFAGLSLQNWREQRKLSKAITKSQKHAKNSMEKSLNQIITESQTTNEAQITLRNLQSNAETYRATLR